MGWMAIVAFAAAVATAAACSSSHTEEPSAMPVSGGGGGSPGTSVLGGTCPDQGDAAACPSLGGQPAWVGCTRFTASTNTSALQSCTCFATGTGEAAWACEETDAEAPPSDCVAASGVCLVGVSPSRCVSPGPQSCNSPTEFCCFDVIEGGPHN
jgi:hypothetical protein